MARYFDGCPFSGSHVRTPFSPYLLFYSLKIVRRVSGGAPLKSLGVHRGRREAPVAHITPFNDRNYALLRYSTSLFLSSDTLLHFSFLYESVNFNYSAFAYSPLVQCTHIKL